MSKQKEIYTEVYEKSKWYGEIDFEGKNYCPGHRLLPLYIEWLIAPVVDLGCGRGHVVEALNEKGIKTFGMDIVEFKKKRIICGDITKPLTLEHYNSCICMDVIEHIDDETLKGLFANMRRVKRQAFSIANGSSFHWGKELHVNRKSFDDWDIIIAEMFIIKEKIRTQSDQYLYLTEVK